VFVLCWCIAETRSPAHVSLRYVCAPFCTHCAVFFLTRSLSTISFCIQLCACLLCFFSSSSGPSYVYSDSDHRGSHEKGNKGRFSLTFRILRFLIYCSVPNGGSFGVSLSTLHRLFSSSHLFLIPMYYRLCCAGWLRRDRADSRGDDRGRIARAGAR
jgi:hypothetical protein